MPRGLFSRQNERQHHVQCLPEIATVDSKAVYYCIAVNTYHFLE